MTVSNIEFRISKRFVLCLTARGFDERSLLSQYSQHTIDIRSPADVGYIVCGARIAGFVESDYQQGRMVSGGVMAFRYVL